MTYDPRTARHVEGDAGAQGLGPAEAWLSLFTSAERSRMVDVALACLDVDRPHSQPVSDRGGQGPPEDRA
jgi:hypothetical protein